MRAILLFTLGLLVACDGGSDADSTETDETDATAAPQITGVYEVTRSIRSEGCSGNTPDEFAPPFFRLEEDGDEVFFFDCRSETDCDTVPFSDWTMDRIDGAWEGVTRSDYISDQDDVCVITALMRSLEIDEEGAVKLQMEDLRAFVDTTNAADCTEASESWNGNGGECRERVVLNGTPVE